MRQNTQVPLPFNSSTIFQPTFLSFNMCTAWEQCHLQLALTSHAIKHSPQAKSLWNFPHCHVMGLVCPSLPKLSWIRTLCSKLLEKVHYLCGITRTPPKMRGFHNDSSRQKRTDWFQTSYLTAVKPFKLIAETIFMHKQKPVHECFIINRCIFLGIAALVK